MDNTLLQEDAGIFMSAFISSTILHMGMLMKGKAQNKWNVPIGNNINKLVVTSTPIQVQNGVVYKLRFTIDKALRLASVRLVGGSEGTGKARVDLLSQEIVDADFNEYNTVTSDNSITEHTKTNYARNTKMSVNDGITTKYLNSNKTVWGVVSDIITSTAQYAMSSTPTGLGVVPLANGILLNYGRNQFGNLTCELDFGEMLLRAAKNDSIFI